MTTLADMQKILSADTGLKAALDKINTQSLRQSLMQAKSFWPFEGNVQNQAKFVQWMNTSFDEINKAGLVTQLVRLTSTVFQNFSFANDPEFVSREEAVLKAWGISKPKFLALAQAADKAKPTFLLNVSSLPKGTSFVMSMSGAGVPQISPKTGSGGGGTDNNGLAGADLLLLLDAIKNGDWLGILLGTLSLAIVILL